MTANGSDAQYKFQGQTSSTTFGVVDYTLESPVIPVFLISKNLFICYFLKKVVLRDKTECLSIGV